MSYRFAVVLALSLALHSVAAADGGLGSKDPGLFNLKGQLVFLPEANDHMPANLASMKVEGTLYTESLDVPEREFTAGFPGVTNRFEWFGLTYTGQFQIPSPDRITSTRSVTTASPSGSTASRCSSSTRSTAPRTRTETWS